MRILITGGLGFIGSHAAVDLIKNGKSVCIVDNLSNSHISVLERLKKITNNEVLFKKCDINDSKKLADIFIEFNPEAICICGL